MGLALTKGNHKIRMVYQIPGIRLGFMVSAAGIALFLLIILGNAIRRHRNSANQSANQRGNQGTVL